MMTDEERERTKKCRGGDTEQQQQQHGGARMRTRRPVPACTRPAKIAFASDRTRQHNEDLYSGACGCGV